MRAGLYWISFTSACVLSMPFVCLGMVYLVATVNWHDILMVVTVLVIQYQILLIRRSSLDRAVRRAESRRAE